MNKLLRRARGILGTAFTWAVAWTGLGVGMGALAGIQLGYWVPMALNGAAAGFLAGAAFAVILSVAERKHTLEDLSLKRVALWGAVGGLLLSFIPLAFGVPVPYLLGPLVINTGIGAGMASTSVIMARRGGGRGFVPRMDDPLLSLKGD